jgi:tRNA(Arg) A34 adenosine deaminase TadA
MTPRMSSQPALTAIETDMLMRFALGEAERGLRAGETPIGSVVVVPGEHGLRIVGRGYEKSAFGHDGHAVKAALFGAVEKRRPGESGIVVVSTVEPCEACMELIQEAPIRQLVYGLSLPATSGQRRIGMERDSHSLISVGGIRAHDCRDMLYTFLKAGGHAPSAIAFVEQIVRHAQRASFRAA